MLIYFWSVTLIWLRSRRERKIKMLTKKQQAVTSAEATAPKEQHQLLTYYHPERLSIKNLKQQKGELLLFYDKHQGWFWELFEARLRQYVDMRISVGQL
jgi:hypothetical protein